MKIYVDKDNHVVALRKTNDSSLMEYELDTENPESLYYNKCDTYLLGIIYGYVDMPQDDGTTVKGFTQSFYKDLTMLETIQAEHDTQEAQVEELTQSIIDNDYRLSMMELGL